MYGKRCRMALCLALRLCTLTGSIPSAIAQANANCHTVQPGEPCFSDVEWAMNVGILTHPQWYPNLVPANTFIQFQCHLAATGTCNTYPCGIVCNGNYSTTCPVGSIGTWPNCNTPLCLTATQGATMHDPACFGHVTWAMTIGIVSNPEWYPALSIYNNFSEFQCELAAHGTCNHQPCGIVCDGHYPVACPPGSFGIIQPNCSTCPAGTYDSDSTPSTPCNNCSIGAHAPGAGTTCVQCPRGQADLDLDSATACQSCSIGQYSAIGDTACAWCAVGRADADHNASTPCISCAPGQYGAGRVALCTNCAHGMFDDDSNATTNCSQCPGSYISAPVHAACTIHCSAGSSGVYPNCTQCEPGKYNHDLISSTVCQVCPAGEYAANTGATTCTACAVGQYSAAGSTWCTDCQYGLVDADANPATNCSVCIAGQYASPGSSVCTRCNTSGAPGQPCSSDLTWAMTVGIYSNPDWYPNLLPANNISDFQCELARAGTCPTYPCGVRCNGHYPVLCPAGSTGIEPNCTECPAGQADLDRAGATACSICSPGRYAAPSLKPQHGQTLYRRWYYDSFCETAVPGGACYNASQQYILQHPIQTGKLAIEAAQCQLYRSSTTRSICSTLPCTSANYTSPCAGALDQIFYRPGIIATDVAPDEQYLRVTMFEAPINQFYGPINRKSGFTELQGYFVPDTTGNHKFYIASDDVGELFIGRAGASYNQVVNAAPAAHVPGWTAPRDWTQYSTQVSADRRLVAGQSYLIVAFAENRAGGDNLAVGVLDPLRVLRAPIPVQRYMHLTKLRGSTQCRICPPGRSDRDSNAETPCLLCDSGRFNALRGQTGQCAGVCPDGTFNNRGARNISGCRICGPGMFLDLHWRSNTPRCDQCPAGQHDHDRNSSTPCIGCQAGTFSSNGSVACRPCRRGLVDHDLSPATPCIFCPVNTYTNTRRGATGCLACPPLSVAVRGSAKLQDCRPTMTVDWVPCMGFRQCISQHPQLIHSGEPFAKYCSMCPTGYKINVSAGGYFDEDECATDNHGCHSLAVPVCTNNIGGYQCGKCPDGLEGTGIVSSGGCYLPNMTTSGSSDTSTPDVAVNVVPTVTLDISASADILADPAAKRQFVQALRTDFAQVFQHFGVTRWQDPSAIDIRSISARGGSPTLGRQLQSTMTVVRFSIALEHGLDAVILLKEQVSDSNSLLMQSNTTSALLQHSLLIDYVCPVGHIRLPNIGLCTRCPAGMIVSGLTECEECPADQTASADGSSCLCADGKYNVSIGGMWIDGEWEEHLGTSLVQCFGQHQNFDKATFTMNGEHLSNECVDCPYLHVPGDCAMCKDGAIVLQMGWAVSPALQAVRKPLNELRLVGDLSVQQVGSMITRPRPVFLCEISGQCLGDNISNLTSSSCGPAYTGALCSNCANSFSRRGLDRTNKCVACDELKVEWQVIIVWIVLLFIMAIAHWTLGFHIVPEKTTHIGVALVIGNGNYKHGTFSHLDTPFADSVAVARKLEELGYVVIRVSNGTLHEMQEALIDYQESMENLQEEKTDMDLAALLYYAGHGCSSDGVSYLVPVDAEESTDPQNTMLSVSAVLNKMHESATRGPSVVVLDACHENSSLSDGNFLCSMTNRRLREPVRLALEPDGWVFERRALEHYLTKSQRSPETGHKLSDTSIVNDEDMMAEMETLSKRCSIVHVDPPSDTVVLMSSPPGILEPRIDATLGSLNRLHNGRSCFATAFLKVVQEDVNILTLCAKIRHLVAVETAGEQIPWELDTLSKHSFCLNGHVAKQLDSAQLQEQKGKDKAEDVSTLSNWVDDVQFVAGDKATTFLVWLQFALPSTKTAVGSGQVLKGIPYAFDLQWPQVVEKMLEIFSYLQFEVFGFVNLSCMGQFNFYHRLIGYTVLPLVLVLCLTAMYRVHKNTLLRKRNHSALKKLYLRTLEYAFLIVLVLYPQVSQVIFQTFLCQSLDEGTAMLVVDFQIDCASSSYSFALAYASLMVVVWPIGLPLVLFCIMFRMRDNLRKPGSIAREAVAPLVENYRVQYWYWESLEMSRKVILTSMMCFFSRGSLEQLAVGAIISSGFLVASVKHRPFLVDFDNRFKIMTDLALVVTFNISLMLQNPYDNDTVPEWVLGSILVVVNAVLPLCLMLQQFYRLQSRRRSNEREKQEAQSRLHRALTQNLKFGNTEAHAWQNPMHGDEEKREEEMDATSANLLTLRDGDLRTDQ